MFHIPDILVSPCIETNSVMVVGRKDVYLNPNFISRYDGGQVFFKVRLQTLTVRLFSQE